MLWQVVLAESPQEAGNSLPLLCLIYQAVRDKIAPFFNQPSIDNLSKKVF